jgi:dTDP-4-dehydrorhamnose 3,5-epimerase
MSASSLPGVRISRLDRRHDGRGSFREAWRASWYQPGADEGSGPAPGFVQANVSESAPGVLRGLHLHRRQVDHWVVLAGRAFVALVDVRARLVDGGAVAVETHELSADDWLGIPPGVAHGFLALEPLLLLYLVSAEYDGSDELGFAWDDPAVAVPWPGSPGSPDGRPTLSERDRHAPSLATLLEGLGA